MSKDGKKYLLQCKRYAKPVGEPIIRDLLGAVIHAGADGGIVVTTSSYSAPAVAFASGARQWVDIELIDGRKLIGMLGQVFTDRSPIPESLLPRDST